MGESTDDRFRETVATILDIAPADVTDDISPANTDSWDSLNQINLIGSLEQEFGVSLPISSLDAVDSIAALKTLLADNGVQIQSSRGT